MVIRSRASNFVSFSSDIDQLTCSSGAAPELLLRCSWGDQELRISVWWWWENKILVTLTMYRLEKIYFVLDNFFFFTDFGENRFRTDRGQFSADSGVRGLDFRCGHCIDPLSRVKDSQRSIKTVWVDQVEWEDPARTCLWVITRRTLQAKKSSKRF